MKDATNSLIKTSVFETIKVVESAWTGHNPFAHWLIQNLVPKVLVELGTHNGNSFFAFCQSVLEAGSQTKCYAVDTWEGDEHAGIYDDTVYEEVLRHNQSQYSVFSELIRGTFDSAVDRFEDATIDLLHIDGLHTYEAVRHDFETWSPKVSKKGLILFHDTCVMERDFGVWKLWKELTDEFPNHYEFTHAYGLGVLNLDKDHKHPIIEELKEIQKIHGVIFSAFGKHQCNILEIQRRNHEIEALSETVASRDGQIDQLQGQIAEKEGAIEERTAWARRLEAELEAGREALKKCQEEIEERTAWVRGLEAELEAGREALKKSQEEIEERIMLLNKEANIHNRNINELQGQLLQKESLIAEMDCKIGLLSEKVTNCDGQIAERDHDHYHLQGYLVLVKSS